MQNMKFTCPECGDTNPEVGYIEIFDVDHLTLDTTENELKTWHKVTPKNSYRVLSCSKCDFRKTLTYTIVYMMIERKILEVKEDEQS